MREMRLPNLHDWEIVSLEINNCGEEVVIGLFYPGSESRAQLVLGGVTHFVCSELRLQNVILDMMLFERNLDSDYLDYCYEVLDINCSVFDQNTILETSKIVFLESSVGAELACCCKFFDFMRA